MQFLSRSKLQLQNRTCKPGAIFTAICRRDIARVSNMFETWCKKNKTKIASSCRDKNRLCNRPRRRRQWESHQTKGLMSRTIAVHVRYKYLYISLPSSAKQQRGMTLGLFCTDLAALGPYCQDLGPIFSQYGPRAWLIRYIDSWQRSISHRGLSKTLENYEAKTGVQEKKNTKLNACISVWIYQFYADSIQSWWHL